MKLIKLIAKKILRIEFAQLEQRLLLNRSLAKKYHKQVKVLEAEVERLKTQGNLVSQTSDVGSQ